MKDKHTDEYILLGFLLIPLIWFALLIAPYIRGGLPNILSNLPLILEHPFDIKITSATLSTVLIFLVIYVFSIAIYISTRRNYRKGEEYGSSQWGNVQQVKKKYAAKEFTQNLILTKNFIIGLDGYVHKRNLNVAVVGGSGAGKTRGYVIPNILQCNCSFFCLDPKGESVRATGKLLKQQGYKVKVFDLIDLDSSYSFNPFIYLKDDNDILRLITNLIKNTNPRSQTQQDPFWEKAEIALLQSLCLYLFHEAPVEEQNFPMIMEMLNAAEVREDDEMFQSPLDELFERLEMRKPECLAVKQYRIYKQAAGKTAKSILVSLGVRMAFFNLPSVSNLVRIDELQINKIAEEKTAIFAVIPDNDSSFNALIGMLYTCLFQQLFYIADKTYKGRLPIPFHFIMDEFANCSLPDDFTKLIATMRSRNIITTIILQNISALKALYKDEWESILGNCDEFLYLGGNEQSTHKYVAELLGKENIDTNTYGKSTGHSGSYSTNYQQTGRELLTADEVRMLDNKKSILFIRGERPILDLKYDLMQHPNIKWSSLGEGDEYNYKELDCAINWRKRNYLKNAKYQILSDEEILKEKKEV